MVNFWTAAWSEADVYREGTCLACGEPAAMVNGRPTHMDGWRDDVCNLHQGVGEPDDEGMDR